MNFNYKSFIQDIIKVLSSNLISLFCGILITFILPKIMSITDFGYYKTFTLYISYVGLFHFGFCDGIYLRYGGTDFTQLDILLFRMYFNFFCIMEVFISLLVFVYTLFFVSGDIKFIFYAFAFYIFFHNINSYYQLLSQATNRFSELSLRTIIYSVIKLIIVLLLWSYSSLQHSLIKYKVFILCIIILETLLSFWYINTYKNISFGPLGSIKNSIIQILNNFRYGMPLLISNITLVLLLNIDRQFVNIFFSKEDFAIYAFAYSLLGVISLGTSAIASVIYPNLKKINDIKLKNYSLFVYVILIVAYFGLSIYFPLNILVNYFLPQYYRAIIIFQIILPGLTINSVITIVMYNYYKILFMTNIFLYINVLILLLSTILNFFVYLIFHTMLAISVSSIIIMILWYLLTEMYFIKNYNIMWIYNFIYMIVMMLLFYLVAIFCNSLYSFGLYLLLYIGITCLFCRLKKINFVDLKKIKMSNVTVNLVNNQ